MTTIRNQRRQRAIPLSATTLLLCLMALARAVPAAERMDQSNVGPWAGGWTHVNPDGEGQATMWQTFTPGCPSLTAVEIDVLTMNPGRGDDVLTVEIARDGAVLASVERSVEDGSDGLLRFEFPQAVPLMPGQIHELKVRDTGAARFGWRYASNTYEPGSRYVFAQPRPGTDWFFRTYSSVEPPVARYSGGTGEPNDPYRIATPADLIALGEDPNDYDRHFQLTADIDLSEYVHGVAPIAPDADPCDPAFQGPSFTGVFDGNGRTVSHLTIQGESYLGLFGRIETAGEVRNLGLVDVNVVGADYVGGLAAFNRGHVVMSYCTGTIRGNQRVGGLVGRNWGMVDASFSEAMVTGSQDAGGLVGTNYGGISASYSTGKVSGQQDIGGLVGENYGSLTATYSTGAVTGATRGGGLVAYNWTDALVVSSFWDTETSGLSVSNGGVGRTTAEMQTGGTFLNAGWDFIAETANGTEDLWWIQEAQDYPRLWWEAEEEESSVRL